MHFPSSALLQLTSGFLARLVVLGTYLSIITHYYFNFFLNPYLPPSLIIIIYYLPSYQQNSGARMSLICTADTILELK